MTLYFDTIKKIKFGEPMSNICYFVDIEATGLDLEDDRIIQLSFLKLENSKLKSFNDLCYTDIEITQEAIAIHNIHPSTLEDKYWPYETDSFIELEKGNLENNYFISHGNELDIAMLKNEGMELKMKTIDTHRCATHLLKDTSSYKLEELIKKYNLDIKAKKIAKSLGLEHIVAHDALSDAIWHYVLYQFLLEKVDNDIDTLVSITKAPIKLETISFGRYKNKKFEDIWKSNPHDFIWMYANIAKDWPDLEFTLKQWLETKEYFWKKAQKEREIIDKTMF